MEKNKTDNQTADITEKINIEDKVMSEINSGRVKLRSKYIFLAEKLGIGSAFALSALLGVLFFTLVLYYLRASDNLRYLSFGSRGLFAFLESFPYMLVIAFIFAIFIAGFILKKSGALYRKPFGRIALVMVGVILIVGAGLAFTSIAERIERRAFDNRNFDGMFFKPLLGPGVAEREKGIAGRIVGVNGNYLEIQTPFNTVKIDLSKMNEMPQGELKEGVFIVAIGEKTGDIFVPESIRVINADEMPMIERGVNRKFGDPAPRPSVDMQACLTRCISSKTDGAIFCRENCINNNNNNN